MGNGRLHVAVYSVNSLIHVNMLCMGLVVMIRMVHPNSPSFKKKDLLIRTLFFKRMLSKTDKSQSYRNMKDIYFTSESNTLNLTSPDRYLNCVSLWTEMHAMIDADDLIVA